MGRPNFGRPTAPPIAQHLHDDADAIDGDVAEGLQHELPTKPKVEAEAELESDDPLRFRWRVPLSWVNNPSGVLAFYRNQLDTQIHDQVIVY